MPLQLLSILVFLAIGEVDTQIFMNVTNADSDFTLPIGLVDSYKTVTFWCECPLSENGTNVGKIILPDGSEQAINFTHQALAFRISNETLLGKYKCQCVGEVASLPERLPYRLCTLDEHLAMKSICSNINVQTTFCVVRPKTNEFNLETTEGKQNFCLSMKLVKADCDTLLTSMRGLFRRLCIGAGSKRFFASECEALVLYSRKKLEPDEVMRANHLLASTTMANCKKGIADFQLQLMEVIGDNVENATNIRDIFYGERALITRDDSLYILSPTYSSVTYQYCHAEFNQQHVCSDVKSTRHGQLLPIFRLMPQLSSGGIGFFVKKPGRRAEYQFSFFVNFIVQDVDVLVFAGQPCGKIRTIHCRLRTPIQHPNIKIDRIKWIFNGTAAAIVKNSYTLDMDVNQEGEYMCDVAIFFGLFNPPIVERKHYFRTIAITKNCLADKGSSNHHVFQHILIAVVLVIVGILMIVSVAIVYERQKRVGLSRTTKTHGDGTESISPRSSKVTFSTFSMKSKLKYVFGKKQSAFRLKHKR